MNSNSKRGFRFLACVTGVALMASTVNASADESHSGGWQAGGGLYFWGASIGGKSVTGSDIDIGIDKLIRNLNMAFMGELSARRDKWTLGLDAIYFNVGAKNDSEIDFPVGPGSISIPFEARVQMKAWVLTPNVRYNLIQTEQGTLDVLAGARYLYLDAELKATVKGPIQDRPRKISGSGSVWDGIVGATGEINLNDKWYAPYYFDVGAGGSRLTWQAMAGVGYRFDKVDAYLTYRYMDYDFDDNDVFDELNMSGPMIGVRAEF